MNFDTATAKVNEHARESNGFQLLGRRLVGAAVLILLSLAPLAAAQADASASNAWELRVCADPDAYPYSSAERPGIDNRVAEILADELGARLTYEWTPSNLGAVRLHLQTGDCDVIMGAAEGAEGVLNTVPYYQAPFVFVYRSDSGFEIESLNDEVLRDLQIAVTPNGLAQYALGQLGLTGNTVAQVPNRLERGADRLAPLVEAVLSGEVDVAIVYGPEAAPYGQEHPELRIEPVTPQIVPPLVQMFRIVTMGVRQGDETLRDRLNVALANRWEDIQAVFEELAIPVMQTGAPFARESDSPDLVKVGAVLPVGTGQPAITDAMGDAAWFGALLAEDLISTSLDSGPRPDVLIASSPTPQAAVRAADRLIATEGVAAVIGGVGEGQAVALSAAAREGDFVFFNLGATDEELREELCSANTFHIEASESMYLEAIMGWFAQSGQSRWFFVYEDSEEGRELYDLAQETLERLAQSGGSVDPEGVPQEAGAAGIPASLGAYREAFDALAQADADAVLMLLPPETQEYFLSQFGPRGPDIPITGFPHPVMQTRDFLARLQQVAPPNGGYRAALWETTLAEGGAADLNERFSSRFAEPLDPTGWAAYAAVRIVHQAAAEVAAPSAEGEDAGNRNRIASSHLIDYLESEEATFDLLKGAQLSFRPHDHQLTQPLYMIELDPDAPWGNQVSRRIAIAGLAGQMPAEPSADEASDAYLDRLTRLGGGPEESSCSLR